MPIDCPWYSPEPKSACTGVEDPMKLMIAAEFGSSGALAMLVFQRLLGGKGMYPFKVAPCPGLIRLQGLICADARLAMNKRLAMGNREDRDLRCMMALLRLDFPHSQTRLRHSISLTRYVGVAI